MEKFSGQQATIYILNQLWLTFLLVISMVLVSRTFVAGTRCSPILNYRGARSYYGQGIG